MWGKLIYLQKYFQLHFRTKNLNYTGTNCHLFWILNKKRQDLWCCFQHCCFQVHLNVCSSQTNQKILSYGSSLTEALWPDNHVPMSCTHVQIWNILSGINLNRSCEWRFKEKGMEIKVHCLATVFTFKDLKIFFSVSTKETRAHTHTYGCTHLHTSPGKAACHYRLASCWSFRSR